MAEMTGFDKLIAFARYLRWTELVRTAYDDEFRRLSASGESEGPFGASFAWMSYWYASLHIVAEAYEALGARDPVVNALLAHPGGYRDLLRRYRNGVFHFQADLTDPRLLDLLNTGGEHVYWVHALHDEFRRHLREQIDSCGPEVVTTELEACIERLTGWLPDEPERHEMEVTLARLRTIVAQEPAPELRERHSELQAAEAEFTRMVSSYDRDREELRRRILRRLGVNLVVH